MRAITRWLVWLVLCLVVLAGCHRQDDPGNIPGSITGVLPPTPTAACSQDPDCVLAYRVDKCCDCPHVYSRQQVDRDMRLRLYYEPEGYRYPFPRLPHLPCLRMCDCFDVPRMGLVCDGGCCREAQTWDELNRLCPAETNPQRKQWCHYQSASLAFTQAGQQQALELCAAMEGEETPGIPNAEACRREVWRTLLNEDPRAGPDFCLQFTTRLQGLCLKEAGETIAQVLGDAPLAVSVCDKIQMDHPEDAFQKDACYHNTAISIGKQDLALGLSICEKVSENIEDCKTNVRSEENK